MNLPIIRCSVVFAIACGGTSATGTVDGSSVQVTDAWFVEDAAAWEPEGRLRVFLGPADGCASHAGYLADVADDATSTDQTASWSAWYPSEFWWIGLDMRTSSLDEPETTLTGSTGDALDAAGQFAGAVEHNLKRRDEGYWESTTPDTEYVLDYRTDGGSLSIERYERQDTLHGRAETNVVTLEGAAAGSVVLQFAAAHCPEVQDAL